MKKLIVMSLIPIFAFLVPLGMTAGGFLLTGCAPDKGDRFTEYPLADDDTLFSRSRAPYLNQLFGYPDNADLMNAFYFPQDTLDSLSDQGFLNQNDWTWFKETMMWLYEGMGEVEAECEDLAPGEEHAFALWQDAVIDLADMAHYTGIGALLNQLFDQVGADFLTHHLHPILGYFFAMDNETWERTIIYQIFDQDEVENKISNADFQILTDVFRRMTDTDDPVYGPVWDAMPSSREFIDVVKNNGDDITVAELKTLIKDLLAGGQPVAPEGLSIEAEGDEDLLDALGDALDEVWENRDNAGELELKYALNDNDTVEFDLSGDPIEAPMVLTFQDELRKLLYSVGLMMSQTISPDEYNTWDDHNMTDLERVLHSLGDVLNEDRLPRAQLEAFLEGLLAASAGMDGANSLGGMLRSVAATEPAYLQGLDHAIDLLFRKNIDGVDRSSSVSQISALRALLHMAHYLNDGFLFDLVGMLGAGGLLGSTHGHTEEISECDSNPFSSDPPVTNCTDDGGPILEWAVGEISNAFDVCEWPFAPGPPPPCENTFMGWNYIFYEKPYYILIESSDPDSGLLGFFHGLGALFLSDYFGALDLAVGADAYTGTNDRAGMNHQLIAIGEPVVQHFFKWSENSPDGDWLGPMISFAVSLNEIEPTSYNFVTDPSNGVLKVVEGPNGYGLATYALRRHYDTGTPPANADLEHGLLDPVIDMLAMIVNELITTGYTYQDDYNDCTVGYTLYPYNGGSNSCSLFSALMFYIENHALFGLDMDAWNDMDNNDIGKYNFIYDLFYPNDGNSSIDTANEYITKYPDLIAGIAEIFGNVLLAVAEDQARYDQIMADVDTIKPILEPVFGGGTLDTAFDSQDGIQVLIDYLLAENEDGSDNIFVANLKALIFKIMDIDISEDEIADIHNLAGTNEEDRKYYTDLYNNIESVKEGVKTPYEGTAADNRDLEWLFTHLYGDENFEGGIYTVNNASDFFNEVLESDINFYGYFVEDFLRDILVSPGDIPGNGSRDTSYDIVKAFTGPALSTTAIFRFFRAATTWIDMDGNGVLDKPFMYLFIDVVRLETDLSGVLHDLVYFFGGPDLEPSGKVWSIFKEIFYLEAVSYTIEGEGYTY